MNFEIPCDVFARLASIALVPTYEANEWFRSVRIDDGVAVASNRTVLACEQIGGPSGVFHINADPALIEQCRKEAAFNSVLSVAVNSALKFAVCKTTLGYNHPGNCGVFADTPNEMDKWRTILPTAPAKKSKGGMFWNTEQIALLGASSPTGRLIFEEFIDASRATVVRDVNDDQWFGIFLPHLTDHNYPPATLPEWIKP